MCCTCKLNVMLWNVKLLCFCCYSIVHMGGGVYAGVHLKLGWDSVKSLGGGTIMANCMGTMNTFFWRYGSPRQSCTYQTGEQLSGVIIFVREEMLAGIWSIHKGLPFAKAGDSLSALLHVVTFPVSMQICIERRWVYFILVIVFPS